MMRTLTMASILTCLLCSPALAQPSPPAAPPPRAPSAPPPPGRVLIPAQSVRVALSIKVGADVRTHQLVISDEGCGLVKDRTAAYEDEVRICSRPAANGLLVEIDGTTRAGLANEYRTRSEVVLARKGGAIEIGRAGGVRYALSTL